MYINGREIGERTEGVVTNAGTIFCRMAPVIRFGKMVRI
jgi:hypothetical protein